MTEAGRSGFPVGHGAGPTNRFFYLRPDDLAAWGRRFRLRGDQRGARRRTLVVPFRSAEVSFRHVGCNSNPLRWRSLGSAQSCRGLK